MSDVSAKPCCSSTAALCPGCGPAECMSCHWKGFSSVPFTCSLTPGHWWYIHSVTLTRHMRTNTAVTSTPSHLLYFLLSSCFFLPLFAARRSPASKLHHWHSDHSTYFNSFQATSSLLSNTWLNWWSPLPSRLLCTAIPTVHANGWVTGIFSQLVTGGPPFEIRVNHLDLTHVFCLFKWCQTRRSNAPEKFGRVYIWLTGGSVLFELL